MITHESGAKPSIGKKMQLRRFTSYEIMEAHDFYKKEYEGWQAGHVYRAQGNLKYFYCLVKLYNGWPIESIAYELGTKVSATKGALKKTELRVETYLKIKAFNDSKEI